MIISCPSCEATFKVDRLRMGPHGRKVKCAKCGNVWRAGSDGGPAAAPQPPAPEPAASEPSMAGLSAREILARHDAETAQEAAAAEPQPAPEAAGEQPESPDRAEAVKAAAGRSAVPGILFRKPPPEPELPPADAAPGEPPPPAMPDSEPAAPEASDTVPEPPVIQQAAAEIELPSIDVEPTEPTEPTEPSESAEQPPAPEPAVQTGEEVAEDAAGEPEAEMKDADRKPTLDPKKRRKLKSTGRQGSMTRALVLALLLALSLLGWVVWSKSQPGLDGKPVVVPPPPAAEEGAAPAPEEGAAPAAEEGAAPAG
jgi:predicted Zn finger-like uncharacterized protein